MTGTPAAVDIAARVRSVRDRMDAACARSGRDPREVTLVAVSKGQPPAAIAAAAAAGVTDFGENYVQEALGKLGELEQVGSPARFHFIGHLQTNKARLVAGRFAVIQSVDSPRLIDALVAARPAEPPQIMLQVNIAGEASKAGVSIAELPALIQHALAEPAVRVIGLMAIPPVADQPECSRPHFRALRELAREFALPALSMGMTDDFEVAIEAGATHIRVGRAIFGEHRL